MIRGEAIKNLVRLLDRRGVLLYHACQFVDLQSYIRLGGVPSRARLTESEQDFTTFETDDSDRDKGVWDKVFVNLSDFGKTFAAGHAATPNPYGPILLRLRPAGLLEAQDIAICLRSAGAQGFDREREALGSVEDVDRLFAFPAENRSKGSSLVKFSKELQREFEDETARDPEVSLSVEGGVLSTRHVISAVVDPYEISGKPLPAWVSEEVKRTRAGFRVYERNFATPDRYRLYGEIGELLADGIPALRDIAQSAGASEELKGWARQLMEKHLEYQYHRFAEYLREGTILPLRAR